MSLSQFAILWFHYENLCITEEWIFLLTTQEKMQGVVTPRSEALMGMWWMLNCLYFLLSACVRSYFNDAQNVLSKMLRIPMTSMNFSLLNVVQNSLKLSDLGCKSIRMQRPQFPDCMGCFGVSSVVHVYFHNRTVIGFDHWIIIQLET